MKCIRQTSYYDSIVRQSIVARRRAGCQEHVLGRLLRAWPLYIAACSTAFVTAEDRRQVQKSRRPLLQEPRIAPDWNVSLAVITGVASFAFADRRVDSELFWASLDSSMIL